jgi:hypothetical protein
MRHGTSRCVLFCSVVLWVAGFPASFIALAQGPNRHGLYVPPVSSFIHDPAEALMIGSECRLSIVGEVQVTF